MSTASVKGGPSVGNTVVSYPYLKILQEPGYRSNSVGQAYSGSTLNVDARFLVSAVARVGLRAITTYLILFITLRSTFEFSDRAC